MAARCKVKAMLILPLCSLSFTRFMNYLHAHSRRPGDAETSSTFRFNPLWVILSLETHTSAAALLLYVSFADSSTNSKTDSFWVSSFERRFTVLSSVFSPHRLQTFSSAVSKAHDSPNEPCCFLPSHDATEGQFSQKEETWNDTSNGEDAHCWKNK